MLVLNEVATKLWVLSNNRYFWFGYCNYIVGSTGTATFILPTLSSLVHAFGVIGGFITPAFSFILS